MLTVNDAIPWAITVIALMMVGIAVIWLELMRTNRMLNLAIKERDHAIAELNDLRLAIRIEMRSEMEKAVQELKETAKEEQRRMEATTMTPSVEMPYFAGMFRPVDEEEYEDEEEESTYTLDT